MRRSTWVRVLAIVLVISMLAAPVSAAGLGGNRTNGWGLSDLIGLIRDIIRDIIDILIPDDPQPTEPIETTPPTVPEETTVPTEPVETEPVETEPVETEPVETEPEETEPEEQVEKVMTVVEHQSNTDNGSLLRATTYNLAPVAGSTETVNTISTFSTRNMAPYALNAASAAATTADETSDAEATAEGTTVKYFPVTMFNYDEATMRDATNKIEYDAGIGDVWNGMYFSGGSPSATSYTVGEVEITFDENNNAIIPDGDYLIYCSGNEKYITNTINSSSAWGTVTLTGTADEESATVWTISKDEDGYYTIQDPDGKYMNITGRNASALSDDPIRFQILKENGSIVLKNVDTTATECYLNALGGTGYNNFGGWTGGSPVSFSSADAEVITLNYADWNFWGYNGGKAASNKFYTGLVNSTLIDDEIVFTKPDGGIFSFNPAEVIDDNADDVKSVYQYVGLPFVLNTETGVYTFDSDTNGVYFANGTPASGTKDNAYNLYFDEGQPQGWDGMDFGDKSANLWAPYNTQDEASDGSGDTNTHIDYHFGMRADLPFSMTPNGRVKSTDDESEPIVFDFAGDDDVWIFIDGVLVIDLGGIHNRLGATVDFAANTITYYIPDSNKSDTANYTLGCYNDPDNFQVTKQLFTTADGEGVIKMTRAAFAADIDHEMQIFYLERGKGTSNCKITFNLPMKDEVVITKDATKSWSQASEDADLNDGNPDNDENAGVDDLTDAEQAIINKIDFGFTLYKKTADGEYAPVANTNFYLEGTGAATPPIRSTNENGHFTLRNGQSARFVTEIPAEGVTYYVVEDALPEGFITPDFNFAGTATGGYDWDGGHVADASAIPEQIIDLDAAENKSYEITVSGSIESTDTIEFICSNFLNAELPNPTATTIEDIIVIDYGLPVDIDPLANDVVRGDSVEIIAFGGENLALGEIVDKDGDLVFEDSELDITLDDGNFHSGNVAFNDVTYRGEYDDEFNFIGERDTFTYTLTKQLTEVEVIKYIIKVTGNDVQDATNEKLEQYDYAIGTIYIVPATIMYYEENFSDMITFTGSNWGGTKTTDGASARQEPGVVGTVDDSTYGSDVAYLTDSEDSNGTSYYGDTTNGAIRFTYTFTGTGTSIFARTSATTGYVQIKVYEGTDTTGTAKYITYRDTYWKDENLTELDASGTLYNIPIYTEDGLEYGTYTVVATVAKAGTPTDGNENGSGNEFYLDGIRVMQPLNLDAEREDLTEIALDAYATDGEANLDVVTLRQKLITDADDGVAVWDGTNFVVMTDVDGAIVTAEEYTSIGPKEEVYLTPGQKVSFSLKYWKTEGLNLYIGMKAPFGDAKLKVGQSSYNLLNAADCYYDVTANYSSLITEEEQATDTNGNYLYTDANGNLIVEKVLVNEAGEETYEYYDADGNLTTYTYDDLTEYMVEYYVVTYTFEATDKIVSLTNIKVVGNYEFTILEDENIDIDGEGNENGDSDMEIEVENS